jgi:5-deoxy-glucuronate isomerase
MSSAILPISEATCVLRSTDKYKGRSRALAPGDSAVRWLHYGRIILDAGDPALVFNNENHETGLICLKGGATITAAGQKFAMTPYDALYIPRDSKIEVQAGDAGCDFAEVSAEVEGHYPLQYVAFSAVRSDPGLHFKAGDSASQRDLNILIGKNVEAGRILAGVTFSEPGNWTSWPPHEHAELLEEAYLYIDMPKPAWGVQFVYTNPNEPELAAVVHEGDCVVMPQGYHPNVSAPGGRINFLWMMAAHRETTDRLFGVVNVQPEYATGGSGLARGQK